MRSVVVSLALLVGVADTPRAAAQCSGEPDNRLVVIGHSNPAGSTDLAHFAEAQKWVSASYVAERLGATYCVPELRAPVSVYALTETLGVVMPDLRTVRFFSSESPATVPLRLPFPPLPEGLEQSPYFGLLELPGIGGEEPQKLRPEELHTNLAVGGATLAGVHSGIQNAATHDLMHERQNGQPYFALDPPRSSQLEIAELLEPKWIIIQIGENDSEIVDPADFESDYRTMLMRLRAASPDAVIVCVDVAKEVGRMPDGVLISEADAFFGLAPGSIESLLDEDQPRPVPGERIKFRSILLTMFGLGDPPPAEERYTEARLASVHARINAQNTAIATAAEEVGAITVAVNPWLDRLLAEGLTVEIDGTEHTLTAEYGGGLYTFDGGHYTKTGHAALADLIISTMNEQAGLDLPPVDLDAVACSDLHVRRALGLSESGFDCPDPSVTGEPPPDDDVAEPDDSTADAEPATTSAGGSDDGCQLRSWLDPTTALMFLLPLLLSVAVRRRTRS